MPETEEGEIDFSESIDNQKSSSRETSQKRESNETFKAAEHKYKNEELLIEAKNFFEAHKKELGDSLRKGNKVIYLDFKKLTEFSNVLSDEVLIRPEETLSLIELAVEESGLVGNVRIRLFNLPDSQQIKIREIRSKHLDEMIVIEGIIRQASDVRPQVVNAKFECPSCGTIISVLQIDKKFREPSRCSCGRRGGFTLKSKEMVDTQRLVLEESPESLSGGEQPKRINVFVKEDLVEPQMEEKTTPGARVKAIGVLKEVPVPLSTGGVSTRFELAIEVNNLIPLEETFEELDITEEDERQILELSQDPEVFTKLSQSITPSVWGYEEIKKSLVLQLFGGVQKTKTDGSKSRGDMHILLIGDPGVAKSIGAKERILYYTSEETGYIPIEELEKKFGRYPKNLKTLTINQKTQSPEWANIQEILKHPPENRLIKITTKHGKEITATKDHSFITLSQEGKVHSIRGEDLTENTYLPLPINFHKPILKDIDISKFITTKTNSKRINQKIELNEDFGFFIGLFLSEGYIRTGKTIVLSNKNKKIQQRIKDFSNTIKIESSQNQKEIIINSTSISNFLKYQCYTKELEKTGIKGNLSRIKKIPEFAFFSPIEFINGLISGLFSGDGRFVKNKLKIKGFELTTISEQLAKDTSDLLFSINILNKINKRKYNYKGKENKIYIIYIPSQMIKRFRKKFDFYGRTFLKCPKPIYSYNNLIPCGELVYETVKKLGYNKRKTGDRNFAAQMRTVKKRGVIGRLKLIKIIKRLTQKTKEPLKEIELLKQIAYSNIIWSKIEKIEEKEKESLVYDLSIPKTNTFVANGVGVHNSVTLGFMARISPKGRYVVGKSASGAGLTATVVRDEYLKGWSLEAGAMVLSNKGLVCIDELEKMDPQDRSAMHEAMEQQCYHYDTIISLADGSERKIGELVEEILEKNKEKIVQGKDCLILQPEKLEVLTTNFKNIFKTNVARISKHKAFNKFIKIKFSNGREIKVTPEHPVFCVENGKIITKRADLIKLEEDIPVPLTLPIKGEEQIFKTDCYNSKALVHIKIPEKNGERIFKLMGYLISEGSREKNRGKVIGVNFTNKDQRLLDEFESLMFSLFNLSPYKQAKIDEHELRYMYRYTSTELVKFFKKNFPEILNKSGEKQIPQVLMKGKREYISKLLSTLFEGDGYVSVKERTIRIGYKTKSKRLAEQMQDLLLRFNIRSNITKDREYFRVGITSYENILEFITNIGFVTPEKNNIVQKYLNEKTIKRTVKNKIPLSFNEKIIEIIKNENIEKVGKYNVYDINYDHLIRKDKFSFSFNFLKNLYNLLKKEENQEFIKKLISEVGWEKVIGIEIIDNDTEKWVYDITIEPNHAFVSQAAILHNTVTISKANVQATLRAETSVLAAANPKFGRFDPYQGVAQQIDLPPTLINRFDIIFTLRDIPDKDKDTKIATHVLQEHKKDTNEMLIPRDLFRKYIAYAKQKIKPELTDEAIAELKKFYVDLRNKPVSSDAAVKPIPISARQLTALIRMSEASAKVKLSKKVTKEDANLAIDIMKHYLMQVGYDYESKTFDIDRISTGTTSSQRAKILLVKETIGELENRLGKLIPIEEIEKELEGKLKPDEIEDAINKLNSSGDIFKPRRGYVQKTS